MTWGERLGGSQSEAQVVDVCREFLAQWEPRELAQLPPPCRPAKMTDGSDVTGYAFTLMRHHCDESNAAALVHKMAAFFSQASTRLAQLVARPEGEAAEERRTA